MKDLDYLFAAAIWLSAILVPYTKVEESFFMQAVHDILKWGRVNSEFDHLSFPGVVPRSFVGPLVISALTYPVKLLGGNVSEGIWIQISARLVLGSAVAWANSKLRSAVRAKFGSMAAMWYGVFCICQFHYTFWTSRMLGNTLALVPMLIAQAHWLRCTSASSDRQRYHYRRMALYLAFTCIVLRFDTAVFAAAMLLTEITKITRQTVVLALIGCVCCAIAAIAVDSYYWQKPWMWPELEVFRFNVIHGRSSEWGISPPHYYFTNFIPRLLLGALPFACIGALADSRAMRLSASYIAAIGVFSANGHKEWRFIFHAVPLFNVCAAAGVTRLYQIKRLKRLTIFAAAAASIVSFAAVVLMTYISSLNYPGGHALSALHAIERKHAPNAKIHIDTYAAMTGVVRFGQLRVDWVYDKTEDLVPSQCSNYTHLITSHPELHRKEGFEVIGTQIGYAGLKIAAPNQAVKSVLMGQLPVSVQQKPLVWIMRKADY
ncbi:alpha-1,6- mannosyltransferase, partial [Dipsacomyces acuminosporus]